MSRPGTLYARVDEYARQRASSRGDVYGWAIVPSPNEDAEPQGEVLLLVSKEADLGTFPRMIAGHKVRLKPIAAPEAQSIGRQCG